MSAVDATSGQIPEWRDRFAIPVLVSAATISSVGNGITALAVPWFVLVTTGSAARTGIAGGLTLLAVVMSGLLGGTAVDRLGFKRASIVSDLLSAVTVALIPTLYFLDVLEYWHLLVLIFLGAIFDGPGDVARRAMIPGLARRSGVPLERANSAMEFATQGSRSLLGPLAAGFLISLMGASAVLYVDAGTFVISILLIGLVIRQPRRVADQAIGAPGPAPGSSYVGDIVAGLRFVLSDDFLRFVIPISIGYNFLLSPLAAVILPVFTRQQFESASSLGLLIGGFGAGSAISTLLYGAWGTRVSRASMLYASLLLISVGTWLLAFSEHLWTAMIATSLDGLATGPLNVIGLTIIQTRVPEEMLGRVYGFTFALGSIAAPAGVFIAGFLIEWTSVHTVLILVAAGTTLALLRVVLPPHTRDLVRSFDEQRLPDEGPAMEPASVAQE